MVELGGHPTGGATALALFLLSYLLVVFLFAATLALGWNLEAALASSAWPQPQKYSRVFSMAFLSLLSALGGLPPFFLLGPKLAMFSWLVSLGALGSTLLAAITLMAGWYIYWQAATGLFDLGGSTVKKARPLTRGGALVLLASLALPLALSGLLLDLWALSHWLI